MATLMIVYNLMMLDSSNKLFKKALKSVLNFVWCQVMVIHSLNIEESHQQICLKAGKSKFQIQGIPYA